MHVGLEIIKYYILNILDQIPYTSQEQMTHTVHLSIIGLEPEVEKNVL